jgi:N-succinyldiaminopimelate aminotransferase
LEKLGLDVRRPEGTYFALSDISSLGWTDGMEFCLALPELAGVVAIPAQPFHDSDAGDQLVRWAFCKEASVIEEGLRRLAAADLTR